jgi:hypothetical protein
MFHLSTLPGPFLIHDLCSTCQDFPVLSSFMTYVPLVNTSRSFPHSWLMFHLSILPGPFLIHDLCSTCQYFPVLSSFMTYVPLGNTSRSFPHSWLIVVFVTSVTRRMPLVEHLSSPPVFSGVRVVQLMGATRKLLTLQEHLNSPPVFSGVRVTRSLVLCVMFCISLFVLFFYFLLAIVLSVLLRFTDYDYPFGIFRLFLCVLQGTCIHVTNWCTTMC